MSQNIKKNFVYVVIIIHFCHAQMKLSSRPAGYYLPALEQLVYLHNLPHQMSYKLIDHQDYLPPHLSRFPHTLLAYKQDVYV